MAERVRPRLTVAEGRRFGLTLGAAFLALGALFWWRDVMPVAGTAVVLGALLALAGIAVPTQLGPVERAWMGLAHAISKVTTPIIMGIVYFLVVTPIGAVMRLGGRNPLVQPERDKSFWTRRDPATDRIGDMTHQF